MTTTTSSSDWKRRKLYSIYVSILRRNLGVSILYFVVQFMLFPLQYMLTAINAAQHGKPGNDSFFTGSAGLYTPVSGFAFTALMVVVPVAYVLLQMHYLHQRRATDMYHALPVRRDKMLLVQYAAAATQVLAPMLLNYLFVLAAGLGFGFACFSPLGLIQDAFVYICSVLAILALTMLVAVSCGTVFDSFVYSCAMFLGVPVTLKVLFSVLPVMLFGFQFPLWEKYVLLTSPAGIARAMQNSAQQSLISIYSPAVGVPSSFLVAAFVWLLLGAGILWLATRVYRRRLSELAGATGYDNGLTVVCKLCGAFVGGLYFALLVGSSADRMHDAVTGALGALAGGALCYCLIECAMARGFKTLRRALPMAAVAMALPALFMLAMGTGGLGYENRVPAVDSVESVTVDFAGRYGLSRLDLSAMRDAFLETDAFSRQTRFLAYNNEIWLQSDEAKQTVHTLHRTIVEDYKNEAPLSNGAFITLRYRLKNGASMTRRYATLSQEAGRIYNSLNGVEEIKRQTHPIFTISAADVRETTLMNRILCGITPICISEIQTQELIEALRADMMAETYQQMTDAVPLGYLVLTPRKGTDYFATNFRQADFQLPPGETCFTDCFVLLTDAYQNTLQLIAQLGYGGFETIQYENIASVGVRLDNFRERDHVMMLEGPRNFTRDSYRERNYNDSFALDANTSSLASPGDIRTLVDLIKPDISGSVAQLTYTDEDTEDFGGWNTSVTLKVCIITRDGTNVQTDFCIDPRQVPEEILRKLKDDFNYVWGLSWGPDGEQVDVFERVLERIRESSSGGALQTAALAVRSAYPTSPFTKRIS